MFVIEELPLVLAQIEKERGILRSELIEALQLAFLSACKKNFSEEEWLSLKVDINDETGAIKVLKGKKDVTPENFGRLSAQTAKQVILQRIREAEKASIETEYLPKVGTSLIGTVQKIEGDNYLINMGRIEAVLRYRDQIYKEKYNIKDKIKVFLVDVKKTSKGPVLYVSRTHPDFLKYLMKMEIPEINDGIIEIKAVSREPGDRAKVAVKSNDPNIGAVGTCVGHMGQRIQNIVKELSDEKIDVIEWTSDNSVFIANALKPAKIINVEVNDKIARVKVNEDQLSLAIGRRGQNIRLASMLTGFRLEVDSVSKDSDDEVKDKSKLSLKEKLALAKAKKKAEDEKLEK